MIKLIIIILLGLNGFIPSQYNKISTPNEEYKFICAHPNYQLIQISQSKSEIIETLGKANREIIKSNINEYVFGQGNKENQIKEGWIYKYSGWDGHIEIYFNDTGNVIGKNCGNG